jgi:hypothetical protein
MVLENIDRVPVAYPLRSITESTHQMSIKHREQRLVLHI